MGWFVEDETTKFHTITDTYETVNTNSRDDTEQRNVLAVNDNLITGASNCETQIYTEYEIEVENGTVLMEPNTAYCAPTDSIKMQNCDAYEVGKKSVTMESNVAYVVHH